jgi:hypothetical protein
MCATCIDKLGKNMVYCHEHMQAHKCQHLVLKLHAGSAPRQIWCLQCRGEVEDCPQAAHGANATPQLLRTCLDLDAETLSDSEYASFFFFQRNYTHMN